MMLCEKKIGPITGIFARIGISIGENVPPTFHVS